MSCGAYTIITRNPAVCANREIDEFVSLVLAGGEVGSHRLRERVLAAELLAFSRSGDSLLGVAGLKHPSQHYRHYIEANANEELDPDAFPFELGWVFILPQARGRGLSLPLCQPLVEATGKGIFATSGVAKLSMHRTLSRLGFDRRGIEWTSQTNDGNLALFVRHTK